MIDRTKLDDFVMQYVNTALWSSTADNDVPMDRHHDIHSISESTLIKMIRDCDQFREKHPDILEEFDDTDIAHDFWLTRNRHGSGFWNGDYPDDIGKTLTDSAHSFGQVDLYIGDDGKIYSM